ncbi:MAG: flagellar hook basal-body protein [Candidatus Eremiobacteraeota bacterium]|nr:flagellar hook basal-body protein [Candidatus Eremiobacteraeota bacterium]MBV8283637.1 flagellar hook basal-body protein [Candidatus Eremiobacteraeota bacterium]
MDGIAWAGSAMVAARCRLEIAAENLANASTDGFARIVARGRLTAAGVRIDREADRGPGAFRRTGRDLDFAIAGEGAFTVRDRLGRIATTRNGAFVRERDGTLSDARGRTLLDRNRTAVRLADGGTLDARRLGLPRGSRLCAGFLETSGADAVGAMVDVMNAQRSFESAEKVVSAIDRTREKSADEARVH